MLQYQINKSKYYQIMGGVILNTGDKKLSNILNIEKSNNTFSLNGKEKMYFVLEVQIPKNINKKYQFNENMKLEDLLLSIIKEKDWELINKQSSSVLNDIYITYSSNRDTEPKEASEIKIPKDIRVNYIISETSQISFVFKDTLFIDDNKFSRGELISSGSYGLVYLYKCDKSEIVVKFGKNEIKCEEDIIEKLNKSQCDFIKAKYVDSYGMRINIQNKIYDIRGCVVMNKGDGTLKKLSESLRDGLGNSAIKIEDYNSIIKNIIVNLIKILKCYYENKIFYTDLKTQNIVYLIRDNKIRVNLIDFGSACEYEEKIMVPVEHGFDEIYQKSYITSFPIIYNFYDEMIDDDSGGFGGVDDDSGGFGGIDDDSGGFGGVVVVDDPTLNVKRIYKNIPDIYDILYGVMIIIFQIIIEPSGILSEEEINMFKNEIKVSEREEYIYNAMVIFSKLANIYDGAYKSITEYMFPVNSDKMKIMELYKTSQQYKEIIKDYKTVTFEGFLKKLNEK